VRTVCPPLGVHLYERWLFYPVPNALLLILTTAALVRFPETGRERWAGAFAGAATLLMLTRQIFHLLWFVGSVATVAAMIPRRDACLAGARSMSRGSDRGSRPGTGGSS
jgi:hypothetical protein